MSTQLVHEQVCNALDDLKQYFTGDCELSFIMRKPGSPDCYMVVTNDNIGALITTLERQQGFAKQHVFVSASVDDVRNRVGDEGDEETMAYFNSLTDSQIDNVLEHCVRKGFTFFYDDGEIDLCEFERLCRNFLED